MDPIVRRRLTVLMRKNFDIPARGPAAPSLRVAIGCRLLVTQFSVVLPKPSQFGAGGSRRRERRPLGTAAKAQHKKGPDQLNDGSRFVVNVVLALLTLATSAGVDGARTRQQTSMKIAQAQIRFPGIFERTASIFGRICKSFAISSCAQTQR
jgi:hypothetical protein